MKALHPKGDRGPGVPEAVPRALQFLWAELGPEVLDRIWIFPPLVSGRSESGLLAVSRYAEGDDPDRRILVTLPYSAERTGKGLTLDRTLVEQGEAPLDRFPRVMEGVVHRAESDLGEPTEVEIQGSEERLAECLAEFDTGLLDPDLPPLAAPREEVVEPDTAVAAAPTPDGGSVLDELGSVPHEEEPESDDGMYDLYATESVS